MPNYYNPYQYYQPTQMQVQPQIQAQQPQVQNGGFVSVRSEAEARNYPVALGISVTFKDESAPYIYTKTMGLSQFDAPRFDKYKLVKEEPVEPSNSLQEEVFDDKPIWNTIDKLKAEIEAIWSDIEGLRNDHKSEGQTKRAAKRKDDEDD